MGGERVDRDEDKDHPGGLGGLVGDILPFTGADIIRFVLLGLLLTAVGALIVHRVRRSRQQA